MKKKVKTFKDLFVWQKAHQLVLQIYKQSRAFPMEEKFGITSQIRRAILSVPCNIVEGHKRKSRKDFLHFLNIADASLEEVKYLMLVCLDLGILSALDFSDLENKSNEVGKMLYGMQIHLGSNA